MPTPVGQQTAVIDHRVDPGARFVRARLESADFEPRPVGVATGNTTTVVVDTVMEPASDIQSTVAVPAIATATAAPRRSRPAVASAAASTSTSSTSSSSSVGGCHRSGVGLTSFMCDAERCCSEFIVVRQFLRRDSL